MTYFLLENSICLKEIIGKAWYSNRISFLVLPTFFSRTEFISLFHSSLEPFLVTESHPSYLGVDFVILTRLEDGEGISGISEQRPHIG